MPPRRGRCEWAEPGRLWGWGGGPCSSAFRLAWAEWERVAWAAWAGLLGAVHVAWCEAAPVPGAWGGRAGDQGQGQVQVASPAAFVFQHFSRCRGTEADAPPDGMGWDGEGWKCAAFSCPFSSLSVSSVSVSGFRGAAGQTRALFARFLAAYLAEGGRCGTGEFVIKWLRSAGRSSQLGQTGTPQCRRSVGRSRSLLLRVDPGAGKLRNRVIRQPLRMVHTERSVRSVWPVDRWRALFSDVYLFKLVTSKSISKHRQSLHYMRI